MKVILLQDVAKIGRRHEIVEVPHGFALNKLVPQGLAKEATNENVKQVQARSEHVAAEHAASDEAFAAALTALDGKQVAITAPANEQGHLFETIKSDRIAEAASEAAGGLPILPAQVHIGTPIKSIGTHVVDLISGERRGELTVEVTAQ